MTKFSNLFISLAIGTTAFACNSPAGTNTSQAVKDSASTKDTSAIIRTNIPEYKAIKFVDDFIRANNEAIKKNTALKDQNEALCTKQLLPLIDKHGLYDDLPFTLAVTTTNNGIAYGNFVYKDDRHFVKVQCILKKKQVADLKENDTYLIKFKTIKFQDAISFEGETGKIEFPVPDTYLTSFTRYQK